MDISFERTTKDETTNEWITPPNIVESLGKFDTDPCASHFQKSPYATTNYYIEDDGLTKQWNGRVWCNPPYGNLAEKFIRLLAKHNNGIALIFSRTDTKVWHQSIFPCASALFFTEGRIAFHREGNSDSEQTGGSGSCFVAYGEENAIALMKSSIKGYFVRLRWDSIDKNPTKNI